VFTDQEITLTAMVTGATGTNPPTGAVNFFDNVTLLNSTPVPLDNMGMATFLDRGLPKGSNLLRAIYVPPQ
jgi:hypothetical protein